MTPINASHMTESTRDQMAEGRKLDAALEANMKGLGFVD